MFKYLKYSFILLFLLCSCGETGKSFKRALTGEKKLSTDEFLVKKKDPLILPPRFDILPLPRPTEGVNELDDSVDIESLLSKQSKNKEGNLEIQKKLEQSILKNIGNN